MADLSQYSTEELEAMLGGHKDTEQAPQQPSEQPSDLGQYSTEQLQSMANVPEAKEEPQPKTGQDWRGDIAAGLRGMREGLPLGQTIGAGAETIRKNIMGQPTTFAEEKAAQEARDQALYEEHPLAYGAGEVAGLLSPVGPAATALKGEAKLAEKLAPKLGETGSRIASGMASGAGIGALYGAGEGSTLGESAEGALKGAGVGAGFGAAAPLVGKAVGYGAGKVQEAFPGVMGAEKAADKKLAEIAKEDIARGKDVLSKEELEAAMERGQPVMGIDVGGPKLRGEARTATNISPDAELALAPKLAERYAGQQDRYTNFLGKFFEKEDLNAKDAADKLRQRAVDINRPNYEKAYKAGSDVLYTPGLQSIASSPAIKKAIPKAVEKAEEAAASGARGSVPKHYSLEFWDNVKRSLDDKIGALDRKGKFDQSRLLKDTRTKLLYNLDQAVPEYRVARTSAADLFGENNAFDAGLQFLGKQGTKGVAEAKQAFSKMKDPEKELFAKGMVHDLMQRIKNRGESRDVTKMFDSPEMREKLSLALGPERSSQLEAFTRVEDLMARAHQAIQSNSTTAKQFSRMGTFAKHSHVPGTIMGGLVGGYPGAALGYATEATLSHLSNVLGKRQADALAKKLASNDPNEIREVVRVISENPEAMSKLRNMSQSLTALTTSQAAKNVASPEMRGAAAEDREERASGGKVGKRDYPAKRLSRMEKAVLRAQKAIAEETKPLMQMPDHKIAQALEIAKDN